MREDPEGSQNQEHHKNKQAETIQTGAIEDVNQQRHINHQGDPDHRRRSWPKELSGWWRMLRPWFLMSLGVRG
jgi:hypothetical protein